MPIFNRIFMKFMLLNLTNQPKNVILKANYAMGQQGGFSLHKEPQIAFPANNNRQ